MKNKAYLVLENGQVFEGESIGASGETVGELVFTTNAVGYLETLSDPGYAGQIILQTFPLIGNYGTIDADLEGECAAAGYVVRELCEIPSNFRSESALETYLTEHHIVGIAGVDTRELTRILRENGSMNAKICACVPDSTADIHSYSITDAVSRVSVREKTVIPSESEKKFAVTVLDCGVKKSTIQALASRGCEVTLVPSDTAAEAILADQPDGVIVSSGPGDPADNPAVTAEIVKLIGQVPLFGIGLGHQLIALAMGGKTVKLPYGHRGSNQPVREIGGNRTYITTQNHGYAVVGDSLAGKAAVRFVNANDGSCEGLDYSGIPCMSVQFDPDFWSGSGSEGPVWNRFFDMLAKGGDRNAER